MIKSHTLPRRQAGLALLVAMIALVAMSLAGIALVRSIDTNTMIAGNLAFRQGATLSADAGTETARTWLLAHSASLNNDQSSNGYYATKMNAGGVDGNGIDLTGSRTTNSEDDVRWQDAEGNALAGGFDPVCLDKDNAGNRVCYVVHRLCLESGYYVDAQCDTAQGTILGGNSQGASHQMQTYQGLPCDSESADCVSSNVYYRVTIRVAGPRNNASYVQTILVVAAS